MPLIPLSNGGFATVDAEDFERVSAVAWCRVTKHTGLSYATGHRPGGDAGDNISMHVFIMNPPKGMEVDHRDGDGLNNQRSNLRVCTHQQNLRNMHKRKHGASRFKGVAWFKRDACWRAYIVVDAKQKHLGYFALEIDAAIAYDRAAMELFGDFSMTNLHECPEDEDCDQQAALVVTADGFRSIVSKPRS